MTQHENLLNMGGPSLEVMQIGTAQRSGMDCPVAIDVGAGAGRNSIFLAGLGFSVKAIEKDKRQCLEACAAQARAGTEFEVLRMSAADYVPDTMHDLGLLLGILHFMPTSSARSFVNRLKTSARAGAVHIVTISRRDDQYENSLRQQSHLDSFHRHHVVDAYADWQIASYESYVKRDNHGNGVIDVHPIEKFVMVKPGPKLVDVKPISLTVRPDQQLINSMLSKDSLQSTTIDFIRKQFGKEDFHVSASSSCYQRSLFNSVTSGFSLSVAFWGTAKCYFENDTMVGYASYCTPVFHVYSSINHLFP